MNYVQKYSLKQVLKLLLYTRRGHIINDILKNVFHLNLK